MNWGEIFIQSFIVLIGLISVITLTKFLIEEIKLKSSVIILCIAGLVAACLMLGSGIWFLATELFKF
jgi:hypothetical protein